MVENCLKEISHFEAYHKALKILQWCSSNLSKWFKYCILVWIGEFESSYKTDLLKYWHMTEETSSQVVLVKPVLITRNFLFTEILKEVSFTHTYTLWTHISLCAWHIIVGFCHIYKFCDFSLVTDTIIAIHYCTTKRTSTIWNTCVGYWAIVYHVIHTKRAAALTHDACIFTTRQ